MEYTISELAKAFDVSTRTIRYYEELGLLSPNRNENGRRIFAKKDYIRLKLIFRGKRFGFKLDEIKEMIVLFDQDRSGRKQLERTVEYGRDRVKEVNARIEELLFLKEEMEKMLDQFEKRLNEKGDHI
ncbi:MULTISPECIES: MerR family transcriptional regulator [Bacillus]|uniref:MerR family transcriptional regulator n=1 Tax=Bacillus TaxID=1386 RepID=UPI000B9B1C6C|nr:MerR family DNA-binding transcriptional regulator [Bacillus sp. AG4(2022)]MCK6208143.1 MerR family DNA-binding transcriptional regulator [Bacillus infantis]MDT0160748.1 MerR family DNA-binding transcriptional regulator [Bacillus sp. AG4(2022)]OXT15046.1 MerR family transcriptional regulator [Bacillus sp. OG2]